MKTLNIKILGLIILSAMICMQCGKNDGVEMSVDPSGKGGSTARFTIVGNYMYVVDQNHLKVFDINQLENPQFLAEKTIGMGIETIFGYGNNLFIGSESGMYVYSLNQPTNPVLLSQFAHVMACDPVVANDSLAFVTLRSGGDCRWGMTQNSIDVIDINNLSSPFMIESYNCVEPYGLGLDGNTLFVCHGTSGVKVYDISNVYTNLVEISQITGLESFDVIPNNGILLVVGPSGFYQYDYSNIHSIQLLSSILIDE